jgi:polyhydroxyalkanoate synthesis regulator phasin
MGIFDEMKRLLWVKKAVAKSAAEKAGAKGGEIVDDISEKAAHTWEKSKDFAEDLGEKIAEKTKEGYHDVKEAVSDLWDKKDDWTQKEPPPPPKESFTAQAGEKISETASKVGDAAGKTWDKAKVEGKEFMDKAVKTSDKVWEKTEEVSEDLWNKAKDVAGKVNKKIEDGVDSMLEKAKELDKKIEEETDKIDANRDGWADTTVRDKMKEHESTLKGKDDFFEKASRYADGDHSMGKPIVTQPGKDSLVPNEDGTTPLPPLPKDDFADDAIIDDGDGEK